MSISANRIVNKKSVNEDKNVNLFDETVEELIKLLSCDTQNWLFGAGISVEANIPLMITLTKRIEDQLTDEFKPLYQVIKNDLPDNYHIEHVLSDIGDLLALAQRSRRGCVNLEGCSYTQEELLKLHTEIVRQIGKTIRYGYKEADTASGTLECIGNIERPIALIHNHREFVQALLYSKANLLSRSCITIFTTNYDTLMEDAFALEKININDGFCGGAIGFWNPTESFNNKIGIDIVKLHGSVDWIKDSKVGLIRNRYGVNYLDEPEDVLIYPQATKYVETQKDPFALLFSKFRNQLNMISENLLICAGYSFGDQHINSEIDIALKSPNNKTTLVVFIKELNSTLTDWINNNSLSDRIFIASEKGIYHGSSNVIESTLGSNLTWWKFSNLIKFI
jgi:hypothetical protein